jgi:hypothetical protein
MNHVMCDLECLDSKGTAAIISIGLVQFDLDQGVLGQELYLELSLEALKQQLAKGRTMSLDTMQWWVQQSQEARSCWFSTAIGGYVKSSNRDVISALDTFFSTIDKPILWGNGSTYDNIVLRGYLQAFNAKVPFHYSRDFCYRTMKNMFGHLAKLERVGTHHNALDDAKSQALHLIAMYKAVNKQRR